MPTRIDVGWETNCSNCQAVYNLNPPSTLGLEDGGRHIIGWDWDSGVMMDVRYSTTDTPSTVDRYNGHAKYSRLFALWNGSNVAPVPLPVTLPESRCVHEGTRKSIVYKSGTGWQQKTVQVGLIENETNMVIVSSESGCSGACWYCPVSRYNGGKLSSTVMIEQVYVALSYASDNSKPLVVSFSGHGDPMNNVSNIGRAMRTLYQAFPEVRFELMTHVLSDYWNSIQNMNASFPLKVSYTITASNDNDRNLNSSGLYLRRLADMPDLAILLAEQARNAYVPTFYYMAMPSNILAENAGQLESYFAKKNVKIVVVPVANFFSNDAVPADALENFVRILGNMSVNASLAESVVQPEALFHTESFSPLMGTAYNETMRDGYTRLWPSITGSPWALTGRSVRR